MDKFIQYGVVAAIEALADAGIDAPLLGMRIGVAVSSAIGGLTNLEYNRYLLDHKGINKVSPFLIPSSSINMLSGHISIQLGIKGPSCPVVTSCSTGTHNIGIAARLIAYGDADVMLAGGAEKCSTAVGLATFGNARAISTRNCAPQEASRPWDKDRDGFVISDGAGVLILEEYEHARNRNARIYAELVGFGMTSDAFHITSPSPDGALSCMLNALRDAKLNSSEISYINAHGTSTILGDISESLAISRLFYDTGTDCAPVSSTKSMMGHMLGAAGAVEAIICILSINNNVAPPTLNLDQPDEGCNLDYIPFYARDMQINVAMSNSFGFGGHNGTLIFKAV